MKKAKASRLLFVGGLPTLGSLCFLGGSCLYFPVNGSTIHNICEHDPLNPACPTGGVPSENSKLITDDYAVFVSPLGKDRATGTKSDPLKSLTQGLARALQQGKQLYICEGNYAEPLALQKPEQGTGKYFGVYGGFACNDWHYNGSRVHVKPASGVALNIVEAKKIHIEDIEFEAPSADSPGESSIVVWIEKSKVTLIRVKLQAGDGKEGKPGSSIQVKYKSQEDLARNPGKQDQGEGGEALPV